MCGNIWVYVYLDGFALHFRVNEMLTIELKTTHSGQSVNEDNQKKGATLSDKTKALTTHVPDLEEE